MKEILKYVGIYLAVYIFTLIACGLFQYVSVCHGSYQKCSFSTPDFNAIITTISYILTPIVAIIGFLSWKNQYNKMTVSQLSKDIYSLLDEQNLLAYRFRGCISEQVNDVKDGNEIRSELLNKSNQLFDKIRLLSKLINSTKLEELNESNRTCVYGIVLNSDFRKDEGMSISEVTKSYYVDYENYSQTLRKLRSELSNYIIV